MSIETRISELENALSQLREDHAAEVEAQAQASSGGFDLNSDPDVRNAAVALAKAIAKAQGFDLPMQVADNGALPVTMLPEEFGKYGGIGISVLVAPPTEAARGR